MPSLQSPLAFLRETASRLRSSIPAYWRRLQILAGSVAIMAATLLGYADRLPGEWVPVLKQVFGISTTVALTAQLACKDHQGPSPTADLEARIAASGGPPTTTTYPPVEGDAGGLAATDGL